MTGFIARRILWLIPVVLIVVSPHGWDNATMQVVPTALVWLWLT